MRFASREEAGRELGRHLAKKGVKPDAVLGLPRGGVIVAAEVAGILQCPMDVLVVRKLGHPLCREFAVGAIAEKDVVLLDENVLRRSHVPRIDLDRIIAEETARLHNYETKFRGPVEHCRADKSVLIVDDGIATGFTVEAAIVSAKKQLASRIAVAVPVASSNAYERLSAIADEVIALLVDPHLTAVGQYYYIFPQSTDEEVIALLHAHTSHK